MPAPTTPEARNLHREAQALIEPLRKAPGGCVTTRLGITPRRCSANSLGGAHPHHCGELCDEAGVSSVTLCRPLLYG
jgi:hypothetical protein